MDGYSEKSSKLSQQQQQQPPPPCFSSPLSSLLLTPEEEGVYGFPSDFNLKLPKPEPTESSNRWVYDDQMGYQFPFFHHQQQQQQQPPSTHCPSSETRANEQARKRRKTISEKTTCLVKLMPWEKKMDTATVLAEAYNYIKFLQAQVSVLQSMPCQSLLVMPPPPSGCGCGGFGVLEKLNRQQLLQVLVNSPVAQTVLAAQGNCVYSLEQLILLKKNLMVMDQMALFRSPMG